MRSIDVTGASLTYSGYEKMLGKGTVAGRKMLEMLGTGTVAGENGVIWWARHLVFRGFIGSIGTVPVPGLLSLIQNQRIRVHLYVVFDYDVNYPRMFIDHLQHQTSISWLPYTSTCQASFSFKRLVL